MTETQWIWRFPRANLLNRRKVVVYWASKEKPPRVLEIDRYMRRHASNVDGFRGIHYDRETGYYRVLVYYGSGVGWMAGDELPGGSESVWFSDLARAVSARDRTEHSYRALMSHRRREDILAGYTREQERSRMEVGQLWN